MKTLKEALFNKKNLENNKTGNKYGISEKDLVGGLEGYSVGIVVRMMEEVEAQGLKTVNLSKLKRKPSGGFEFKKTEAGHEFWADIIFRRNFENFYKRYPEYKKYN